MCEREVKTKAFSKEGLTKNAKIDPCEIAKMECTDWIKKYILSPLLPLSLRTKAHMHSQNQSNTQQLP